MNPNLALGIGVIAAFAAALACAVAHPIARRLRWGYVPRYVCGVAIGIIALAFPLFGTLEAGDAALIILIAGGIFGAEGLATWIAHDASPDRSSTPEADEMIRQLDEELRK